MGTAISTTRAALEAADDEEAKKTKRNLEILQKLVDSRLDKYEADLDAWVAFVSSFFSHRWLRIKPRNSNFLNPTPPLRIEVPGIRVIHKQRFSTADIFEEVRLPS